MGLLLQSARAALLLYEPFSTTTFPVDDTKLGRTSGQWSYGQATDANDGWSMVRSAAALSYSSLVTSNGSRGVARIANTYPANRNIGAPLGTSITSGSVYCSFLVNVATAPTSNRALLALNRFTGGNIEGRSDGMAAVVWLNPSRELQLGKYSTTVVAPGTTAALESGVTYLVVLKYTFLAGADEVALYLNPLTADPEPGSPTISTTTGTDSPSMQSVWLPQGQSPEFGSYTGELLMDEIRVGETWADVLPNDGQAPPMVREPHITEVVLTGSDLVLSGTNGPPNGGYQALRSPDLAQPLAGWQGVGIESFEGNGDFSFTSALPVDAASFYAIRVISTFPLNPPVITMQPQDVAISVGQNAEFNVTATGTAPLTYFWYYNTNTLIASGTNTTFVLANAQVVDSGRYSVMVSNLLGATNSSFANLTVTNSPPFIVSEPTSQFAVTGMTAVFTVEAGGTPPLHYQWYYNTNTSLLDATNSTLTLLNVHTNQVGTYSVTITNLHGSTNSIFAELTVSTNSSSGPIGWAAVAGLGLATTTGGAGGPTVIVSNAVDLLAAIANPAPLIIRVSGLIALSPGMYNVTSDKTIEGIGANSGITGGGLNIGLPLDDSITSPPANAVKNVIIRNLNFSSASEDNLNIQMFSHHVWVDHCTFASPADGALDYKRGSDYVTFSYNHFDHVDKTSLVGHADDNQAQSTGRLRATYHNNWFQVCQQRQPRVRYGRVHLFNNYYEGYLDYAIGIGVEANIYAENNYFIGTGGDAYQYFIVGQQWYIRSTGHLYEGDFGLNTDNPPPDGEDWLPSSFYAYTTETAAWVKANVKDLAGAGKGSFPPE